MPKSYVPWLVAFVAYLTLSLHTAEAQPDSIMLSDEESAFLEQLGPVSMCVDPDWMPFEYLDEDGNFAGIAADLLKIISERSGVALRLVPTDDWNESLVRSQQGDCIILPFLNQTPDREEWLLFTEPYFTDFNVFITREEHDYIPDPALLIDKTVVLPTGTSIEERIRRQYPNLEIMLVENETDALYAVNNREADMTLRSLTMAAYIIKTEGWFNLKIAGQLPDFTNMLRIGVAKEHPLLVDILNKAIATITTQEVQQAINNHVAITIVTDADYTWVYRILIGLAILVAIGLAWNYQLRRLNKKLSASQQELLQLSDQLKLDIAARKEVEAKLKNRERQLAHQNDFYRLISEISAGFINSSPENIDEKIDLMLQKTGHFLAVDRTFLFQFSKDEKLMSNTHEWCAEGIMPVKDTVQNYPVKDVPMIAEVVRKKEMFFVPDVDKLPEGNDKEELKLQQVQSVLCLPIIKGNFFLGYYGFDSVNSKRNIDEVQMGLLQVMANILGDALIRNTIELEKKKAEDDLRDSEAELREINAQKDKFFSIIAHDLKSPFNSIMGFSELLADLIEDKDYDSSGEYAKIIKQSSKKVMSLLENLLEWARTQTGRIKFNPEYFEMVEFIEETASLFDAIAVQKSITIKRELPQNLPVFADKPMISTVMRNLVSNAIKFTREGGEIIISARNEKDRAVVSVRDNGIGMPKEQICKVFRLAESESTPGTANEKGTGLGLVLCKEFIENHGGKIWVESKVDEGSTFTFTIPRNKEEPIE